MAATQLGTDLILGVGQTMGSYIVADVTVGNDEISSEDVVDEDGKLKTRYIMDVHDVITLSLIPMSGATPATDFIKGGICGVAPLSNYYIRDVQYKRVPGHATVEVTGENLGIT